MSARPALLLALAALVWGCREEQPLPQRGNSDEPTQQMQFSLGQQGFTISLPVAARARQRVVPHTVMIDGARNYRLERLLQISTAAHAPEPQYQAQLRMKNGGVLHYHVNPDAGGGSGGGIGELQGRAAVGAQTLFISCTDQDEFRPDPEWCLPYVVTLQAE